jgi:AcrR family transcriptional regulator
MPKFSENELEIIRELLLEKGKALFIEYGLKKTSIDDIVQACDIAKGSFYKFFTSKEELYFEIFKREEEVYIQIYNSITLQENGKNMMTTLIKELWSYLHSNPFLKSFYERNVQELLFRKIPREAILQYTEDQKKEFTKVIDKLQPHQSIGRMRPELVVSMIRGVLVMSLHKQSIGEPMYEEVMNHLIQFIGDGIEGY